MTYRVIITESAEAAILEHARYIAVDQQEPVQAGRWLERIYDAADTLGQWPRRCMESEESEHRVFEIRKLNIDGYFLLFTIVEETNTVWVIGARHGRMLPRLGDLPESDANL